MKFPLDCQLLSLGIKFVRSVKENDWNSISELIGAENENCLKIAKSLIENNVLRSLMENFCTLHAMVEDPNQPKIFLEFFKNENENFSQTLICSKVNEESAVIQDIISNGEIGDSVVPIRRLTSNGLSPFEMLEVVVPFNIADAICDTDYAIDRMSANVEAFGFKGHDVVVRVKEEELAAQKLLDLPAYKLEDPFIVDFVEERVQLGFECVMESKPGRGTDFVSVDSDKLVCKINAVRHK